MPKIEHKDLANISEMSSSKGFFSHKVRDPKAYEGLSEKISPAAVVRALDTALLEASRELAISLVEMAMYGDSQQSGKDADKLLEKVQAELKADGDASSIHRMVKKELVKSIPVFLHTKLSDEEYEEQAENWCDKLDLDPDFALSSTQEVCAACGEEVQGIDFGYHKHLGVICKACIEE